MKTPIRAATVFLVGLTLVLSNVSIASAAASTGYLDRTFSDDGKAVTNVAGDDTGEAMAIQADGKIVVAGTANGGTDIAVVRYDTDGTLDGTFGGGDGKVVTDISGDDAAFAIAIQGDQKILVGGFADGTLEAALLRYDTGGALDSSFGGGDGIVLTPVGMGAVYEDLVVQPDDAILAGGTMTPDGIKGAFLAVRYDSAGTPDATFGGGDGIQTTTVGASGDTRPGSPFRGTGRRSWWVRPSAGRGTRTSSSSGTTRAVRSTPPSASRPRGR